jgi:MFS family permease
VAQRHRRFSSVTGFAVLCGPLLGGAVVQGISWPWIFWLNLPIAIVLIPLALTRIDESFGPRTALDLCGLACRVRGRRQLRNHTSVQ